MEATDIRVMKSDEYNKHFLLYFIFLVMIAGAGEGDLCHLILFLVPLIINWLICPPSMQVVLISLCFSLSLMRFLTEGKASHNRFISVVNDSLVSSSFN